MVNIVNCSVEIFLERTKKQEVIAFGAGRVFESLYETAGLKRVQYIIDSNEEKVGTYLNFSEASIPIVGKERLKNLERSRNAVIITATLAAASILKELDSYENIDGMDCYILPLMVNKVEKQEVLYASKRQKIPKIIHYCWFGKTEIPDHLKRYMESWDKYCPDYEIIRWDESNYDISKNQYMREAYESKKWGFVPDYARLDIVHQYGGIYLDTDVEMVQSFDKLLCSSSFFGYADLQDVNLGHGFGSEKGNPLLDDMKKIYEEKTFIKSDGTLDLRTCIEYQRPVLKKWGFHLNGKQESIRDNVIYPREVFNPLGRLGINELFTDNTYSIHHAEISWESEKNRRLYQESVCDIKKRIERSL